MHDLFYILHLLGMSVVIISSAYLLWKNDAAIELRKKIALTLMSAAHLQLLTGLILFFLMLSDVNHMKIGIKMLLAIEMAVLATIFRKKISTDNIPNKFFLPLILLSGVTITAVAFLI
jgi:hypothetical protein